MSEFKLRAGLLAILGFAFPSAAFAECSAAGADFDVARSDNVTYSLSITDRSTCRVTFETGGMNVFSGASILTKPRAGALSQPGGFTFIYQPKGGATGQDSFSVKVCGRNIGGNGCSIVTYAVTVR